MKFYISREGLLDAHEIARCVASLDMLANITALTSVREDGVIEPGFQVDFFNVHMPTPSQTKSLRLLLAKLGCHCGYISSQLGEGCLPSAHALDVDVEEKEEEHSASRRLRPHHHPPKSPLAFEHWK